MLALILSQVMGMVDDVSMDVPKFGNYVARTSGLLAAAGLPLPPNPNPNPNPNCNPNANAFCSQHVNPPSLPV